MKSGKHDKNLARGDSRIQLKVIPGHFRHISVTYHSLSGSYNYEIQNCRGTEYCSRTGC